MVTAGFETLAYSANCLLFSMCAWGQYPVGILLNVQVATEM